MSQNNITLAMSMCCLRSVAVITCASHAQGPQFDPGRRHFFFSIPFYVFFIFRRGEAIFRSDNMSTISVLKEVLSKETAQRKTQVKFSHGMHHCICSCVIILKI